MLNFPIDAVFKEVDGLVQALVFGGIQNIIIGFYLAHIQRTRFSQFNLGIQFLHYRMESQVFFVWLV